MHVPKNDDEAKVLALHPEGKQPTRIDRDKYEDMRRAMLAVIREAGREGAGFSELPDAVLNQLDPEIFEGASVMWYVTTVKLDLEARGLIERVPGRGRQRLVIKKR